ncbi:hypothetical protein B0H13DRAFT_1928984 [Mycena leptocephala]|nr:hypothetical protein B0H13DRAFT_1928984 [Mycena leptocephala]
MGSSSFPLSMSVGIPDPYPAYANFKHRLRFTWYILQMHVPQAALPFWWAAVSGVDANGDLWFWEDEDEEYALETRQLERRRMASPLSHLTPQSRFRFMAWFIVAEVARKGQLKTGHIGGLHDLIACWGMSLDIVGSHEERCRICGVSGILGIWLKTMLEVYMLDDLRLIPWYPECSCFNSRLATIVPAGQNWATKIHLGRDSTALRVLFELVVPPWPLIVWVVFRTMDLFAWDDVDAAVLYRALVSTANLDCFLGTGISTWWKLIWYLAANHDHDPDVDRPRRQPENLWIRLAAVSVEFSATLSIPRNILAPFNLSPKQFPLASITHVVHENYKTQCALGPSSLKNSGPLRT